MTEYFHDLSGVVISNTQRYGSFAEIATLFHGSAFYIQPTNSIPFGGLRR